MPKAKYQNSSGGRSRIQASPAQAPVLTFKGVCTLDFHCDQYWATGQRPLKIWSAATNQQANTTCVYLRVLCLPCLFCHQEGKQIPNLSPVSPLAVCFVPSSAMSALSRAPDDPSLALAEKESRKALLVFSLQALLMFHFRAVILWSLNKMPLNLLLFLIFKTRRRYLASPSVNRESCNGKLHLEHSLLLT